MALTVRRHSSLRLASWVPLALAAFLLAPLGRALGQDAAAPPEKPGGGAAPDAPKPDAPKPDAPKPEEPKPGNGAAPAPAPEAVKLQDGVAELARLKEYLHRPKSDNQDIIASLDQVLKAYRGLVPNDDAGKATFEADKDKFQKDAENLFVDALELNRVKPNSDTNERDDVNVRAAQVLAQTRPEATPKITAALDKVFKAKYTPATTVVEEAFKAIGTLGDTKTGLDYCVNWIKYSNNKGDPERIKSAFDALILFKEVKGPMRRTIVEKTLTTFESVEHTSALSTKEGQQQKRVWDVIKPSVIKALQYYCKEPKAKDGALVASVAGFREWFKENDKPRSAVWTDPKAVEQH